MRRIPISAAIAAPFLSVVLNLQRAVGGMTFTLMSSAQVLQAVSVGGFSLMKMAWLSTMPQMRRLSPT
jgi:hypothetical protein